MQAELGQFAGWGRVLRSASVALHPEKASDIHQAFTERPRAHGLIARGAGRAYGDCAMNAEGALVLSTGLNRVLAFDPNTGAIEVEPGVTFRQLMAEYLPRGWIVPVTPGTGFATIAGAVANDVHGKNHELAGSFTQHVTELDLLTPAGVLHTIGPDREQTLFRATCGGLGLTGLITRIAFRMRPVASPAVTVRETVIRDLEHFLSAMSDSATASYTVGWIDGTASGASLGRGILETAEPAPSQSIAAPSRALRVPLDFPEWALTPATIKWFNAVYYRRVPKSGRTRTAHYAKFFYPLDAITDWNRIYGRRGFHQFQNVVPFANGPAALRELLELIAQSRRASFLAVLKRLGPGAREGQGGHLSFPMPGYTLALDFPAGPGIEDLYAKLVAITSKYGGRIYLAKDALLTPDAFRAMYPAWRDFQAELDRIDPQSRLQSDMSRRLHLRQTE